MFNRDRLSDLLGSVLIAATIGASLTLSLMDALGMAQPVANAALTALLSAIFCGVLLLGPWPALGVGVSLAAFLGLQAYWKGAFVTSLSEMFSALGALARGGEVQLFPHAPALALALCVLLTLLYFGMSRLYGGIFPAVTLAFLILLGGWFFEQRTATWYALPAIAALAVLFARTHDRKPQDVKAAPLALIAALLALWLVPAGHVTYPPLEQMAEKVRQLFYDYFLFTDPRISYSIRADGFQMLDNHLGGPADPQNHDVMLVTTDHPLLLRGAVKRTYTTTNWVDNALNNRYLFIDPGKRSVRDNVFDMHRPTNRQLREMPGLFQQVSAGVEFTAEGTSTLFVPHRLRALDTPVEMVPYYNNSGEVFITRPVKQGDKYQFTALLPGEDDAMMDAYLSLFMDGRDAELSQIAANYTQLPQGIENGVYMLTDNVTSGLSTPYQKAAAIRDFLLNTYTYTLTPPIPPGNRDFVSYFLLSGEQGYCTYFASAMAVMGRIAGLPTRYVEGYMVPPDPSGTTQVTGKFAHAWAEVYFEGVGWIAFNPTPGDGRDAPENPDNPGQPPEGGEPSPTPTPQPTPTPPPPEEEEPDEDEPEDTPEPPEDEDDPQPPESEDEPPEPEEPPQSPLKPWMLWLLLALAALAGAGYALWRRLLGSRPDSRRFARESAQTQMLAWYRAILLLLSHLGHAPAPGETPLQFAARIQGEGEFEGLLPFAEALAQVQYANHPPSAEMLAQAKQTYTGLLGQLTPLKKLRWAFGRVVRGLGDLEQIP